MRVLAIDAGFTAGYAVFGDGIAPFSGSRVVPGSYVEMGRAAFGFESIVRELLKEASPEGMALAKPFVGKFQNPNTLGPIFGFDAVAQKVAYEFGVPCYHVFEPSARAEFIKGLPRLRGASIKEKVIHACLLRGWPVVDDHAADALCVAAYAYGQLVPLGGYKTLPIFAVGEKTCSGEKSGKKSRRAGRVTKAAG